MKLFVLFDFIWSLLFHQHLKQYLTSVIVYIPIGWAALEEAGRGRDGVLADYIEHKLQTLDTLKDVYSWKWPCPRCLSFGDGNMQDMQDKQLSLSVLKRE